MTIGLLDYRLGNLGSVANMFKRIGAETKIVANPDDVLKVDRLLLPGVGAFDHGMTRLDEGGLSDAIRAFVATGRPLLGICLGMQLLLDSSEEGAASGLGLIEGRSMRFPSVAGFPVPHMGWNAIASRRPDPLLTGAETGSRFYFVHSYHVVPTAAEHILATTDYGVTFASIIRSDNVMGAQFHPEKSHVFGMTVLKNFSTL